MKIRNACYRKLSNAASSLPDVGAAIMEILQPAKVSYVQKQQIAGYTQEVLIEIDTKISIQSMDPEKLQMRSEGQRSWNSFRVYALSNLDLDTDSIFTVKGDNYRILSKTDWKDFGFIEYSTVEDYDMNKPDPTQGLGYVVT